MDYRHEIEVMDRVLRVLAWLAGAAVVALVAIEIYLCVRGAS